MGIENLDGVNTAKILEMYVALVGIILLTPICLPEQNKDIRDLVEAKFTSVMAVTLIRILEAVFFLIVFVGTYILILKYNNCIFPYLKFYLGTLAQAIFLGGLGFFAYQVFDQIAIAYMFPMVYYIINFGTGKKLVKEFYLFSMTTFSYKEKKNLAILGIILIILGVIYPFVVKKLIPKLIPHRLS